MNNNNQAITNHALGLFIINTHQEILLHKRTVPNHKVPYVWEPPLLEHNQESSALSQAQTYLETLDLDCELHELFTSTTTQPHHIQPFNGGCIIIALHKDKEIPLHFATDNYKWIKLDKLVQDIHEKPVMYATWLKKIIDGAALYLKNIAQEKHKSITRYNEGI